MSAVNILLYLRRPPQANWSAEAVIEFIEDTKDPMESFRKGA